MSKEEKLKLKLEIYKTIYDAIVLKMEILCNT